MIILSQPVSSKAIVTTSALKCSTTSIWSSAFFECHTYSPAVELDEMINEQLAVLNDATGRETQAPSLELASIPFASVLFQDAVTDESFFTVTVGDGISAQPSSEQVPLPLGLLASLALLLLANAWRYVTKF